MSDKNRTIEGATGTQPQGVDAEDLKRQTESEQKHDLGALGLMPESPELTPEDILAAFGLTHEPGRDAPRSKPKFYYM